MRPVLRGIHIAPQIVARAKEKVGELAQCQLRHSYCAPCTMSLTGICEPTVYRRGFIGNLRGERDFRRKG